MTLLQRPFTDEDLPRLQAAVAEWRREGGPCGVCHLGELTHRIYEELHGRGDRADLVQVWEDADGVAGVAICLLFGVAFDVFTRPALRGTDAERELLRAAAEITASRMSGGASPWVVTDVFDCDHVREALVSELGFARHRLFDHVTERSTTEPTGDPEPPEGYTIRRATLDDADQLAAVLTGAFGRPWSGAAYRDDVMARPAYDSRPGLVVVATDGRIAALTMIWLDETNRVGCFEPVATHPDFRRRGLARALMLRGLIEMRRAGMRSAIVSHDATNIAALKLYRGLGFEKRFETYGFRRPASPA